VILSQASALVHHHAKDPDQPSHSVEHSALVHHKAKDPDWDGKSVQEEPKYSGDYPKDDNRVGKSPPVQRGEVYDGDYPKDENGSGKGGSNGAGHGRSGTKQYHIEEADGSSAASSETSNSSESGSSAGASSAAGGSKSKPAAAEPPVKSKPAAAEPPVKAPPAHSPAESMPAHSPAESMPEFSPSSGHTAEWYESKCSKIKAQCEERKEAISRSHREKVHRLEDEYKGHAKGLDRMEDRAADSEQAVDKQKTDLKKASDEAKAAAKTVEETKDCPKELRKLEDELEKLEAEPNDSDTAIDEECQKKKEILKKESCVERYVKARSTLGRRQVAVGGEADSLSGDRDARDQATDAVKPHQDSTDDAKTALDKARENGASGYSTVDEDCKRQLHELEDLSNREVATAESEYRHHKDLLESRRNEQKQAEEDVTDQKKHVDQQKRKEEDAEETHDRLKDCPAELDKAERELRELEATSNDSDEDIDAECEKKKVIMRKRRCVDEFSEARDVLARRERKVANERQDLTTHEHEEKVAQTAANSYKESTRRFKQAWEDAKAARRALQECADSETESSELVGPIGDSESRSGSSESGSSEGGSSEEKPKKGGAGLRHPSMAALLLGPLLALLLQHTHV